MSARALPVAPSSRRSRRRRPAFPPGRQRNRGTALLIALIALGVLLVASVALLQSTYAAADIIGNASRKQAATQAADVALQEAASRLGALVDFETSVPGAYAASQLATDTYGLPTSGWDAAPGRRVGSFTVQYLIDRLCDPPLPVVDAKAQCATASGTSSDATSHKVGAPAYTARQGVYFRLTARVVGPKGSESFVQAVVSR